MGMGMGMVGAVVRVLGVGSRRMSTKAHHPIPKAITKAIKPSSSSSEFRKFLGIPHTSRSQNALLISKFIKINTFRVSLSLSLSLYIYIYIYKYTSLHVLLCFATV
jgi:hypothetical protein